MVNFIPIILKYKWAIPYALIALMVGYFSVYKFVTDGRIEKLEAQKSEYRVRVNTLLQTNNDMNMVIYELERSNESLIKSVEAERQNAQKTVTDLQRQLSQSKTDCQEYIDLLTSDYGETTDGKISPYIPDNNNNPVLDGLNSLFN